MAWCCQATSHYLSQCWPRFMLPYCIISPQWVKKLSQITLQGNPNLITSDIFLYVLITSYVCKYFLMCLCYHDRKRFHHGLKTSIELIRFCWSSLKPESCHGANFVLTGNTCAASEDKVGVVITWFFSIKVVWGMFSLIHTWIPRQNGRYSLTTVSNAFSWMKIIIATKVYSFEFSKQLFK